VRVCAKADVSLANPMVGMIESGDSPGRQATQSRPSSAADSRLSSLRALNTGDPQLAAIIDRKSVV